MLNEKIFFIQKLQNGILKESVARISELQTLIKNCINKIVKFDYKNGDESCNELFKQFESYYNEVHLISNVMNIEFYFDSLSQKILTLKYSKDNEENIKQYEEILDDITDKLNDLETMTYRWNSSSLDC
jgi:hypothetical protein